MKFIRRQNMIGWKFWELQLSGTWYIRTDLDEYLQRVLVVRLGKLFIEFAWI